MPQSFGSENFLSWVMWKKSSDPHLEPPLRQPDSALDSENEQRLHELLNAFPAAVYTTDSAGRITFYNEAAATLWGCRPTVGSDEWSGSWRSDDRGPIAIAPKDKRAVDGREAVVERPDGTRIRCIAYPSPIRDSSGSVVGAINVLVDITERKRAEEAMQWLASIVESSDDAIVSKDLNGIIASWNAGAQRLFGYAAEEVIGKPVTILIPEGRDDEEPSILGRLRRGQRIDHYETVRKRKDGTLIDVSLTVSPVRDADGKIIGASKIARDITERKRKERHIALLMREIDHRSKNLLALVQATVHLSSGETPEAIKMSIDGRIRALATVHGLLVETRWEGAALDKLIREELAPYCKDDESRALIIGPDQMLPPDTGQSIAVALHELVTNAVKYGALSVPDGRVRIEWSLASDGDLIIRWTERHGPSVSAPTRQGFGTRVIERMIGELKGKISFGWQPQGLECEILIPAAAISRADPARGEF